MELLVTPKGGKYEVQDKKNRVPYTVKKKGLANRYDLFDASGYNLYTLQQDSDSKKPTFAIVLNGDVFIMLSCKSMFLDPTIEGEGDNKKFSIKSKDRMNFSIMINDNEVGHIKTVSMMSGELQYEIEIENNVFDDYIPLFAIAIDKAFGEINRNK